MATDSSLKDYNGENGVLFILSVNDDICDKVYIFHCAVRDIGVGNEILHYVSVQ